MGCLYLIATPIGNLEDLSPRAARLLGEVALIAAEDTRRSRQLLSHLGLHTPLTSYYDHNKSGKLPAMLAALRTGDVALVSDGGTPGVSDPGYELVRAAIAAGYSVVPVPGPSAVTAALVASGLPCDAFVFAGFLPRKVAERRTVLAELATEARTVVVFEAPHRLLATLQDIAQLFGERPLAVARELTKLHEEIVRGTAQTAHAHFLESEPRGEVTLVIGGSPAAAEWALARVQAALQEALQSGLSAATAAKQVAADSGWTRRALYQLLERK